MNQKGQFNFVLIDVDAIATSAGSSVFARLERLISHKDTEYLLCAGHTTPF
jgi:hypothetical protein